MWLKFFQTRGCVSLKILFSWITIGRPTILYGVKGKQEKKGIQQELIVGLPAESEMKWVSSASVKRIKGRWRQAGEIFPAEVIFKAIILFNPYQDKTYSWITKLKFIQTLHSEIYRHWPSAPSSFTQCLVRSNLSWAYIYIFLVENLCSGEFHIIAKNIYRNYILILTLIA